MKKHHDGEDAPPEPRRHLEAALSQARIGVWRFEAAAGLLWLDEIGQAIFGLPPGPCVPCADFLAAVHPADRDARARAIEEARHADKAFDLEYRIRRPSDGQERWIYCRGGPAPGAQAPAPEVVGVSLDITDRKRAEEALRRANDDLEARVRERTRALAGSNALLRAERTARQDLLRRLVQSQEDERRRFSRELHDQMGQGLTALLLGLQALEENPADRTLLAALRETGDVLARQMHDVALDLRPTALDDLGLTAALRHYVERWSRRSGIPADFHAQGLEGRLGPGGLRLRPEVETALYRIAQEALTNAARHAQPRRVGVLLERLGGGVGLIVEDDGLGFDADAPLGGADARLGLVGMRERAALVGGTVEVESTPGRGTTVFARIAAAGLTEPDWAGPERTASERTASERRAEK